MHIDDDVNLYAYVSNDPLNATDPTGMERIKEEFDRAIQERGGNLQAAGPGAEAQAAEKTLQVVVGGGLAAVAAAPVVASMLPAAPAAADAASTALSAARGAAAIARAEGATAGATTGAVTASGEVFTGASTAAGGPGVATNATVQAALDSVPQAARSAFHGCCGEINALSNIANAGGKIEGTVMATVRAAGRGADAVMKACPTCRAVAEKLGVRVVE